MTRADEGELADETPEVRVIASTSCCAAVPTEEVPTPGMPEVRHARGWASVAAVALGAFVIVMTETLPVGLLPQIATGLGIPLGPAGLIILVPGFTAAVAAPLFYRASNRVDRRVLILLLGLTVLVSNAVVAVSPDFALVLVARTLFGATLGAFWTVVSPVGPRFVGAAQGTRAISIIAAGISGGIVVGLPAGQLLGNLIGWRLTFAIAAGATAVVVIAQAIVLPAIAAPQARTRLTDLGRLVARPAVRFGMAAGALAFIGQFTAYTYFTPFLQDQTRLPSGTISLLYLLYGVAGIVGSVVAGTLFKRGVITSFAGSAIAVGALVIALAYAGMAPGAATGFVALWGGFWGIVNPGTLVWLLHASPDATEAASALNVTYLQVALAIGSGLGAILVSAASLHVVFVIAGAFLTSSGAVAFVAARLVNLHSSG